MNGLSQAGERQKCNLAVEVLRSFGQVQLRVAGTSMLPTLWPGDLLTIEPTPIESILPGDLVVYARQHQFVVHRVVKGAIAQTQTLVTRGDAVPHTDSAITSEQFLGRVTRIHRNGRQVVPARRVAHVRRLSGRALFHFDRLRSLAMHCYRWWSANVQAAPSETIGQR